MDSLHEIRIACEGLKSGSFIALEEGQIILLGIELGELQPGHVGLQVVPASLDRVQLVAIRGQEEQTDVLRGGELGGGGRPTVVQHEDLEAVGEGVREGVDEELEHLGVQIRRLEAEPVTRRWLHGAIDIEPLEDMLDRSNIAPGNDESVGKQRSGKTRQGNQAVRTGLTQLAHAAARTKGTYLSALYQRLAARRGKKRAIIAVAHSIVVSAFHMLIRDEPYRELGDHYFDNRRQAHLVDQLTLRIERLGYRVTLEPVAAA
jgi:hypothetical protein